MIQTGRITVINQYSFPGNLIVLRAGIFKKPGQVEDVYGVIVLCEAHFSGGNVIELDREIIGNPPGTDIFPEFIYNDARYKALEGLDYAKESVGERIEVFTEAAVARRAEQVRRATEAIAPKTPASKPIQAYRR